MALTGLRACSWLEGEQIENAGVGVGRKVDAVTCKACAHRGYPLASRGHESRVIERASGMESERGRARHLGWSGLHAMPKGDVDREWLGVALGGCARVQC
jgi:hypothetical protein